MRGRSGTPQREFLYEIQDVQFTGNKFFSDDELFSVIDSRNTDLGFFQYLVRYYGERVKRNPAAPKQMKSAFDNVLRNMQGEIQYFNQEIANKDARAIEQLYNKSGFHWAKASYNYARDSITLIKILTFTVEEGDQALLDTVVYAGIDSLPETILTDVLKTKTYAPGNIYSESAVQANVNAAYAVLQDSGYYYAKSRQPQVTVLSATKSDSVYTLFTTGKRQRISKIIITDSLNDQSIVSANMKQLQLEIHEGDWYNRSAVERSINNLYELTTFDVVSIDTIFDGDNSDTTISLQVFLRYRKQNEVSGGIAVNHTTIDNFTNLALDATYINRNIFGAAQNFTVFMRPQLLNISRAADQFLESIILNSIDFDTQNLDWELQTGVQLSQPYLFTGLSGRWSGSLLSSFSYRYLVRPLQLGTWTIVRPTLTAKFPKSIFQFLDDSFKITALKDFDFYDQLIADLPVDHQYTVNYGATEKLYQSDSISPENKRAALENLYIYRQISRSRVFITSVIPSLTIIGDRRNDFFSPSTGYYTTLSVDKGFLLSNFWRFQGILTYFRPLSNKWIFAAKGRLGKILWSDPDNTYVPFERHFFAGGSNSVRGWPSRELRAPIASDTAQLNNELRILQDITGSATIIEGSVEGRLNFGKQNNYFLSDIVSEMGMAVFVDVGNTFHRLTPAGYQVDVPVKDYFLKLAVAAGAGIRYNTPVGPLRLDVATRLYDPALKSTNFKHIQLHIGLGHAF